MVKPPADVDPEKYILGKGVYTMLRTACPYYDGQVFRIDPGPVPVWTIITFNLIFISCAYAFYWVASKLTDANTGLWAFAIAAATCILFTVVAYSSFANTRRLGPWLIYDQMTNTVEIPRQGVTFQRREIVHLQYITTKRLDADSPLNHERLTELNLVTCRDGVRQRWPLLGSLFNRRPFDPLVEPLLRNTDLPVVRVKDSRLGWRITETPYANS